MTPPEMARLLLQLQAFLNVSSLYLATPVVCDYASWELLLELPALYIYACSSDSAVETPCRNLDKRPLLSKRLLGTWSWNQNPPFVLCNIFCSQIAPVEAWRNRCTALPSSLSNVRSDTCCSSSLVGCCLQWCLYARFRACILLLQYGHVTTVHSACVCAFSLAVMASKRVLLVSFICCYKSRKHVARKFYLRLHSTLCFLNVPFFNVLLERFTWLLQCFCVIDDFLTVFKYNTKNDQLHMK